MIIPFIDQTHVICSKGRKNGGLKGGFPGRIADSSELGPQKEKREKKDKASKIGNTKI